MRGWLRRNPQRISYKMKLTGLGGLEGINRIAFGAWPDMGFQSDAVGNIDPHGKQILDSVDDSDILKNAHRDFRGNLHHDVDVAVEAGFAARDRAEQSRMRHALRAQGGFVLPQPVKDFLPVHDATYTTKRPCRNSENATDFCTSFLHKKSPCRSRGWVLCEILDFCPLCVRVPHSHSACPLT